MSSVIDNDDRSKQWAVVTVVLYSKDYDPTNEVKDFYTWKYFYKGVTDFMHIRLLIQKG